MKIRDFIELGGNAVMYALTFTNTKELFEIISLGLSILISLLIIISKVISWMKKAKEDGKITKEELDEGVSIIVNGVEAIKNQIPVKEEKDVQGEN